jgi:hypothetical protein
MGFLLPETDHNKKSPPPSRGRAYCYEIKSGGVLLSHAVTHVVPSALQGLTTEFGMGSGVTPAVWPPETLRQFSVFCFLFSVGANLVFAQGEYKVRPYGNQMNLEVKRMP